MATYPTYNQLVQSPGFLGENAGYIGMGIGLLPALIKMLSGSSSSTSLPSLADTKALFPGASPSELSQYAAANPGITNGWSGSVGGPSAASTGANAVPSLADTKALFPGASASELPAYAAANVGASNGWGGAVGGAPGGGADAVASGAASSGLGGLSSALSGLAGLFGGGSTPPAQATPIAPPAYPSGTGTNSAMFNSGAGVNAATLGGGPNSRIPLGPAANNPLLAALAQRYGSV